MAAIVEESYPAPQWLDRTFLQTALREGLRRGSLDVNTLSIKLATKPGDNYLSQMFRVTANVVSRRKSAEDLSFVIKSLPKGENTLKFCSETQMFAREIEMLSDTLPMFNRILAEIQQPKLSAKLFFLQTDPEEILVLEDLCRSGYRSVNRLEYLDLPHAKLVAQHLALFHAASLAAFKKNPSLKESYFSSFWSVQPDFSEKFLNVGIDSLRECLKRWKILPEVLEKFEKIDPVVSLQKLLTASSKKDDEFVVLNHGDPWTSNFMFKYTDQQPTDMRFVDFQISCVNSPVYDLLYFINTSLQLDIRTEKVDEILETYYKKLAETCGKLNIPLNLSFDELSKTYYEKLFFGFFVGISVVPFMSIPSEETKDLNDYLNSDSGNANLDMYLNDNFKKAAETLLPYYLDHGMLD